MTNEELVSEYQQTKDVNITYTIYEQNISLFYKLIRPYVKMSEDEEDLMQQCYLAVYECYNIYEPNRGASFSTVLVTYVKKYVCKYIRYSQLVISPALVSKYQTYIQHNPNATQKQILHDLNLNQNQLDLILTYCNVAYGGLVSLDKPLTDNDGSEYTLGDLQASNTHVEEEATENIYKGEIWAIVKQYTSPRGYKYIKAYYKDCLTYSEIAEADGMTHNAVREFTQKELRKLRTGRARRILKAKYNTVVDQQAYRSGYSSFKYKNTSVEERIILEFERIEQKYQKRVSRI